MYDDVAVAGVSRGGSPVQARFTMLLSAPGRTGEAVLSASSWFGLTGCPLLVIGVAFVALRSFVLLAATGAVFIAAVAGCSQSQEEATVRTAAQARHYIDDVLRGTKKATAFKLADEATPVARAAVEDAQSLSEMQRVVDEAPQAACDAASIISNAAQAKPDSPEPVTLYPIDKAAAERRASTRGVPDSVRDTVFNAALQMAQSTLVSAADKACNVAQNS